MKKHAIGWVQALRGIAALMVVLCHARFNFTATPLHEVTDRWMRPGAMGVDLFFVVSGFIMVCTTRSLRGTGYESAVFLAKRFARIWPVYAVILMLKMGLDHFFNHTVLDWPGIGKALLFLPVDPRNPPYFSLPYGIGWTLNFEIYFYLVFGLSMLTGRYRWAMFFGWMACTLIGIPLLATQTVSMSPLHDYRIGLGYVDQLVNPIIWDFVAGVGIGLIYTSRLRFPDYRLALAGVFASIALAFWWAMPGRADFDGMLGWGGPIALAFAFMALAFKYRPPRVPSSLLWLGEISFSLYLMHIIAFETMLLTFAAAHPEWRSTWTYTCASIGLALLFASISNKVLEKYLSEQVRRAALWVIHRVWGKKRAVAHLAVESS